MTTGNFTVDKAFTKLMCRVTDATVPAAPVYGCSSDQFAVRPGNVTLTTTATAVAPSASNLPAIKAGASFSLRATTSTNSTDAYSGSLMQDTSKLTAQTPAQDSTQANGGTVGNLTPVSLLANAAAVNATYSEVGYLYLAAQAFRDTTYTAVDGNTDCVSGSTSTTLSSGKYGCVIGTTSSVSLGRFYPSQFAVVSTAFAPGCGSFTYMGQPLTVSASIQAQNAAGAKTNNFSGAFARASVLHQMENDNNGSPLDVARLTGLGSPVWTAGAYPFVATGFSRPVPPAAPDGAFDNLDIGLQVVPTSASDTAYLIDRNMDASTTACTADPAGTSSGTCKAVRIATGAKVRFGVVKLQNAYGSELLALDVPVQAQYFNAGGFVANSSDSCTALTPPVAIAPRAVGTPLDGLPGLYFYTTDLAANGLNKLASTDTVPTLSSPLLAGKSNLRFPKPSKRGWLDIVLQVPPYLSGSWGNCGGQPGAAGLYDDYPCAKANFGMYKSPLIYRRENY
jgi:MSHA biogenesis protein MshQ